MQTTYKTISGKSTAEFKDRGSKFLGYAFPVSSNEEIKEHLQVLKKEHSKAVHHCFAWRLGNDGHHFRANDDGEPSGSAGKPILGQIDSKGLTNILIAVVRYFGGTLLGVPGLINAYKTTAEETIQNASVIEKNVEAIIHLEFQYNILNEVMNILKQHDAHIILNDMQLFCTIKAGIPLMHKDQCYSRLNDLYELEFKEVDQKDMD